MKCLLLLLVAAASVHGVSVHDFSAGQAVPDGNLSGLVNVQSVSGLSGLLTDVNVHLVLAAPAGEQMFNGDLYVTLIHSGRSSVLLNRAGLTASDPFGFADNGFSVTFDDDAANGDVHTYRLVDTPAALAPLTGVWAPDGRDVHPNSAFPSASRTALLNEFTGLDPNGAWALFVADPESGGVAELVSWRLELTTGTTPTPVPEALSPFAFVMANGLLIAFQEWRRRRKLKPELPLPGKTC